MIDTVACSPQAKALLENKNLQILLLIIQKSRPSRWAHLVPLPRPT